MTTVTIAILAILAVLVLVAITQYNKLISLNNGVSEAFAQIEVKLRSRSDLNPHLVEKLKG